MTSKASELLRRAYISYLDRFLPALTLI